MVGIELPDYALEISDLVAIDNKRHFAEEFLPAFVRKARQAPAEEEIQPWIDAQLKPYGSDARLLVDKAFRSYVKQARAGGSVEPTALDFIERAF